MAVAGEERPEPPRRRQAQSSESSPTSEDPRNILFTRCPCRGQPEDDRGSPPHRPGTRIDPAFQLEDRELVPRRELPDPDAAAGTLKQSA